MSYKCVHCSALYADASSELLTGCSQCHSKFFFYIKEEKLKEITQKKEAEPALTASEKEQMEADVREIAGLKDDDETPVFLDFESIRVIKPGKYLLDLSKLFAIEKPRVYQLEDGKYIVDLAGKTIDKNQSKYG